MVASMVLEMRIITPLRVQSGCPMNGLRAGFSSPGRRKELCFGSSSSRGDLVEVRRLPVVHQRGRCRRNAAIHAPWKCFAENKTEEADVEAAIHKVVPDGSVSVILLAGGTGKRMGASMPKQYLPLLGQPIALYSFHTFSSMPEVGEIIVVCDPSYRDIFEESNVRTPVKFALPGKERQDSVWSGLQVIVDAWTHGAAVLGVPCKATIKEARSDGFVQRTLDRKTLWEMQTPQVIQPLLLRRGFELVERERLEVTDDVSIVEHLKHPVLITEGCYTNLKVTTPDDLLVAERILHQRSS